MSNVYHDTSLMMTVSCDWESAVTIHVGWLNSFSFSLYHGHFEATKLFLSSIVGNISELEDLFIYF